MIESKGCGVLDTRLRGYDIGDGYLTRRLEPFFGQQPHRGVGIHRLAEGEALGVFAAQLIEFDRVRIRFRAFRDHVDPITRLSAGFASRRPALRRDTPRVSSRRRAGRRE